MKKHIGDATLELVQGDITALKLDAIVNAANKYLAHGGGVALAIVRKGGSQIQVESTALIAKRGPLVTGEAVITSGGKLPAKFVIHTVGPVWHEQSEEESDQLLRKAVRSCLTIADEKELKQIALPAISTGIYGFPMERAAPLMLKEVVDHLRSQTKLERVVFCLYDSASYRIFESALAAL
ncbi:MAG TPA: macro domain-containing protein [Verrucomicrobiae bacterium]|nr:macro domain-containing protein [Verrucomicrobiae bacterium]